MPTVILEILEGRTAEQKRAVVKDITDTIAKNFKVPPDVVRIIMHEYSKDCIAIAGKLVSD